MKKLLFLIGLVGILALLVAPVMGQTLYEEEGTGADGTPSINAAGKGPTNNPSRKNWKYQYGSASQSSVWSGGYNGEYVEEPANPETVAIEVEADVELFTKVTIQGNHIYFHLGNIYDASASDLRANVTGTYQTNHAWHHGIYFPDKDSADFQTDGGSGLTGVILGGMKSTVGAMGNSQNQSMDIKILWNHGSGLEAPASFGSDKVLWWPSVPKGTYNFYWQVTLMPTANQADGDYYLDPVVMTSPAI